MAIENAYTEYFNNADQAKGYAAEPSKFMSGYDAMHRMASVLLNEHVPREGDILVHGEGGGAGT